MTALAIAVSAIAACVFIWACCKVGNPKWHRCPWCGDCFTDLGDRRPGFYAPEAEPLMCDQCAAHRDHAEKQISVPRVR